MVFDFGVSRSGLLNLLGLVSDALGKTDTQTITNKQFDVALNNLIQTTPGLGAILVDNGTKIVARARPAANLPLHGKSDGSDIEYSKLEVAGGGTGQVTLSTGTVLIGAGTSGITTKANPAGAFLGTSDIQNVTGLKTWSNSTMGLRDPTGVATATLVNPSITTDADWRLNNASTYYVFKEGSTYYAKSGLTQTVVSSSTTLTTVLNALLTLIGTSKKTIELAEGDFTFTTTLTPTVSHNYLTIRGQGYGTRLISATDIPVLYSDGCLYLTVENLAFANDSLTTKTSAFVDLGDSTQFNTFRHIQMMQNNTTTTTQKGTGFRFICDGVGACYFNTFDDIVYRGLNYCNIVDTTGSATASVWVNGNHWINNRAFYFLSFIKVSQKGGGAANEGHFDANGFIGLDLQCNPSGAELTTTVFDFEGVAGDGLVTCRMADIIVWDKNAASFSLKVTPRTTLMIQASQNLADSVTGTGAATGGAKIAPFSNNQYLDVYTATAAPSDPITTVVRSYATVANAFNVNYVFKTKVNGVTVPVTM